MLDVTPPDWPYNEKPDLRPRYRLCKLGFALASLALGLQCADLALSLGAQFFGMVDVWKLVQSPRWRLLVGTPITWSAVLGAYLLLGRWRHASWNRRAGVLMLMNAIDLGFWASDNGRLLGLSIPELQDPWLRYAGSVLQWFELMLFALLAADVSSHLGRPESADGSRLARSFAMVGLTLWFLILLSCTTWLPGRGPVFRIRSLEVYLLILGSQALLAITAFQVTILCSQASRECARLLAELGPADHGDELLRSRSEGSDDPRSKSGDPWA